MTTRVTKENRKKKEKKKKKMGFLHTNHPQKPPY